MIKIITGNRSFIFNYIFRLPHCKLPLAMSRGKSLLRNDKSRTPKQEIPLKNVEVIYLSVDACSGRRISWLKMKFLLPVIISKIIVQSSVPFYANLSS